MAKQPAHEIRYGLIKATIWENDSKKGRHYTVAFTRLFRDGSQWRESNRYFRDDLLLLEKLAGKAHSWIMEQTQSNISDSVSGIAGRRDQ